MSSSSLRISVVTPCLNDAQRLEQTLRSIHDQGFENLEHIVIDGGSTDGSAEIIRRYADRLAYWCSEPDEGHGHALWKGLRRATGDVLTWVCSNDLLLPGSLAAVARFFHEHPEARWAAGNGLVIDEDTRVFERVWAVPFTFRSILFWELWGTCQPAVFMRREAFEQAGGVDRSFDVAVDTDLFIRLAKTAKPVRIDHFLGALRVHQDSQSARLAGKLREANARIRRREGLPPWPAALLRVIHKLYEMRFRGIQRVNELLRHEKHYAIGAPLAPAID